ncbi:MAG: hypothetical protein EOO04_38975, partial [Chitinophagaceae bacterium]
MYSDSVPGKLQTEANNVADNFVYIVSSQLDYHLLICADAGPEYAVNLGWKFDYFDNIHAYLDRSFTLVIDTRLSIEEYEAMYQLVSENPATQFIAAVTDPYYEECID